MKDIHIILMSSGLCNQIPKIMYLEIILYNILKYS